MCISFFRDSWDEINRRKSLDPLHPCFKDVILALISYSFITIVRIILVPIFCSLGRVLISKDRYKGDEFEMHVQRFSGQLWKFIFHSTVTVIPLIIFRGQPWWIPGFGGIADMSFEKFPFTPLVPWMREFYMFQLGYYFHSIVITFLQVGRPNLISMTIHHLATTALVSVSYLVMNASRIGSSVMFVHDICDVFICLLRIVADTKLSPLVMIVYPTTMIVWVIFRLYILPFKLSYSSGYTCFKNGYVDFSIAYSYIPLNLLLVLLVIMHWKWFIELLQMGTKYLKTGATDDTTDSYKKEENKEDKEESKKKVEKVEKKKQAPVSPSKKKVKEN